MGAGDYFGGLLVTVGDKNGNSEATALPCNFEAFYFNLIPPYQQISEFLHVALHGRNGAKRIRQGLKAHTGDDKSIN